MWERVQSEVISEWTPECPSWREPYGCNECEEVFTDQSSFTRHMRSHTGERNYMNANSARKPLVEKCTSLYTREFKLKRNFLKVEMPSVVVLILISMRKVHTGNKPYNCN